jgi:hypothetical protein
MTGEVTIMRLSEKIKAINWSSIKARRMLWKYKEHCGYDGNTIENISNEFLIWIFDSKGKRAAAIKSSDASMEDIEYVLFDIYLNGLIKKAQRRQRILDSWADEQPLHSDHFRSEKKAELINILSNMTEDQITVAMWAAGLIFTDMTGLSKATLYKRLKDYGMTITA